MLVTFTCNANERVTLFGDVAQRLLRMMGQSGVVPSALLAADIPAARTQLQHAIDQEKQQPTKSSNDDEEPTVSLVHRALPLIKLLQAAEKQGCNVLWA